MWMRFMDMHSGGSSKTDYEYIYIEAENEHQAIDIFQNKFEQHPYEIACSCCGSNFSIDEAQTLRMVTAYNRFCKWSDKEKCYIEIPKNKNYMTLEAYKKQKDILIIYNDKENG